MAAPWWKQCGRHTSAASATRAASSSSTLVNTAGEAPWNAAIAAAARVAAARLRSQHAVMVTLGQPAARSVR